MRSQKKRTKSILKLGPHKSRVKFDAVYFYCEDCAKASHLTKSEAKRIAHTTGGYRRVYFCELSNSWHTTSMTIQEFEESMAKNMTLIKDIQKYLEGQYTKYNKYKFYTKAITDHFSHRSKGEVASTLSYMKKDGIITSLDEKVPHHLQKGATYFALTSVLEKITNPDVKSDSDSIKSEIKKEEVSTVMTVPQQPIKPGPPVANPFDEFRIKLASIQGQLEEILGNQDKFFAPTEKEMIYWIQRAISESTFLNKRFDVAEQCYTNFNVQFENNEDSHKHLKSLIMELTEDTSNQDLLEKISSRFDRIEDMDFPTQSISSDYQRGLKDGIKLAVEMGLMFRNGE